MSSDNVQKVKEDGAAFILEPEEIESSEEPPAEEWSSLMCLATAPVVNKKRILDEIDLLEAPSSEEMCGVYLPVSDSSIYRHPMQPYPALHDPGIKEALLDTSPEITYKDDGQDLYIDLCKQMNEAPCRLFHRSLLRSHINLSYYCVSPMGFRPMAMALRYNNIVKSIDLTNNFISLDGCFHFGDILLANDTLEEMNFSGCRMGAEGLNRLVSNLPRNKTLLKLDLSGNELKDEGVEILAQAIIKGCVLTHINLSYNNLTENSAFSLANALDVNNRLVSLNFSWNNLSVPRNLEILAMQLKENTTFTELDLSWNSLSKRFAKALSIILETPNLRVLKLDNNDLDDIAISEIGARLSNATKLETLDLSYNPMSIDDAKRLLRYMSLRTVKLKNLLLDNVTVDEQFIMAKNKILSLKHRKDSVITHGYVNPKLKEYKPDLREVVLNRAQFVCSMPKAKAQNVGLLILQLNKLVNGRPLMKEELRSYFVELGASQINLDLCESLTLAFPGPGVKGKAVLCDVGAMVQYVKRKFPDAKLPPTPPQSEEEAPVQIPKGKEAVKGKK